MTKLYRCDGCGQITEPEGMLFIIAYPKVGGSRKGWNAGKMDLCRGCWAARIPQLSQTAIPTLKAKDKLL